MCTYLYAVQQCLNDVEGRHFDFSEQWPCSVGYTDNRCHREMKRIVRERVFFEKRRK